MEDREECMVIVYQIPPRKRMLPALAVVMCTAKGVTGALSVSVPQQCFSLQSVAQAIMAPHPLHIFSYFGYLCLLGFQKIFHFLHHLPNPASQNYYQSG